MTYSTMYVGLWLGVLLITLVIAWLYGRKLWRIAKVVFLILRTRPYQQTGTAGGKTILIAGDSTGYGTGVSRGTQSIAGLIGRDYPEATIYNRSVNGRRIDAVAKDLATLPMSSSYDVMVLQVGGNDILQHRNAAAIEADLRNLLTHATARAHAVIMMSCGNVGAAAAFVKNGQADEVYEQGTRTARAIFMRLCEEYNVYYADLFLEPADDVFLQQPRTYLACDGLHPSAAGYAFWYRSLAPILSRVLGEC